ncbi:hypothetical protein Lbys_2301 [Leadbetterella byssophila DSM 17132]|uniref:Uncharacterized protein n=1 Tax=Leadbetterella byssophila (strain DSM 17132 / JCM 16389 / KACC 11308 / NBRC 106382 / 4M15) TaxID=649349 RepID=E4RVT0_LEAB4|nr:hypothetical protein Lbys_2301 [Leadbetterella byssophila DSM 17132]
MPAQSKYFSSKWARAINIVSGILGGYLLSASFHLFLSSIESIRSEVIILSGITFFILWASLIIIPFLSKRGWLVGGTYLALTVLFYFLV